MSSEKENIKQYNEIPDEDDFSDIEDEIIGYHCIGCGHIQDYDGECEMCTGFCLDPIYF